MATIGSATKREDGLYEGEHKTLSVRADIVILPIVSEPARLPRDVEVRQRCVGGPALENLLGGRALWRKCATEPP